MSVPQPPVPSGPEMYPPVPSTAPSSSGPSAPSKKGKLLTSKPVIGVAALVAGMVLGSATATGGTPAGAGVAALPAVTVTATATQTVQAESEASETAEPTERATEETTSEATEETTPEATEEASAEPAETEAPKPEKKSYASLSKRKFKLLAKDPDAYIGKTYVVYGEITQFDSATGTDAFRADAGAKKLRISYGYVDYEQNSFFYGDESDLDKLVEGDCFKAKVTVLGSYSYDTQAGGNTTVPMFQVESISVYGSTD